MNNEPVAWIAYDEFGDFMLEARPEGDYPWQPLYTHPAKTQDEGKVCARCGAIAYDPVITQTAKTLTDEEIMDCIEDKTGYSFNACDEDLLDFARAILRKAQEK
jgi:hypothetical protein